MPTSDSTHPYITEDLWPLVQPISNIATLAPNPRRHNDNNLRAIKESLKNFKQLKPVVLHADGVTVIAGNGTLEAARILGWEYIAVVGSGLDGDEAKAYTIADNRTGDISVFDDDLVSQHLAAMDRELASGIWADDDELNSMFGPPPNDVSTFEGMSQQGEGENNNAATTSTTTTPAASTAGGNSDTGYSTQYSTIVITGNAEQIGQLRGWLSDLRESLDSAETFTDVLLDVKLRLGE